MFLFNNFFLEKLQLNFIMVSYGLDCVHVRYGLVLRYELACILCNQFRDLLHFGERIEESISGLTVVSALLKIAYRGVHNFF